MGGWWVASFWNESPMLVVAWAAWVIVSITLHELAHGWAAIRQGDTTPIELGRMTFNPVVHMGGASLIAFALLGIAWGSMPVNPSRFKGRHGDAFVAIAGPAMNVTLAAICVVLLAIAEVLLASTVAASVPDHVADNVRIVFRAGAILNVVLALFNLLPIPPLDGSRVLASFWRGYDRLFSGDGGQFLGLGLFIAMFLFGFGALFTAAAIIVDLGVLVLTLPFV